MIDNYVSRQKGWLETSKKAFALYEKADEGVVFHKYLKNKGIEADPGMRYLKSVEYPYINNDGEPSVLKMDNVLVIPAYGQDGYIKTLQLIDETGKKRFLPGGQKAGNSYMIGDPTTADKIILAEGIQISSERVQKVSDIRDAFSLSMERFSKVDIKYISEVMSTDEESVKTQLIESKLAYFDFERGLLIDRASYLSGNVRKKHSWLLENKPDAFENIEALRVQYE